MPSRRSGIRLAGGALASAAGCLSAPTGGAPAVGVPEHGTACGEADAVTVEQTGAPDDNEYVPSNDTVRYPATMSGGEVDEYGYISFQEWGDVEGASVAADAVQDRLDATFGSLRQVPAGISKPEGEPLRVSVTHRTELGESSDVLRESTTSVPALVDETPWSVTATVHFAGKTRRTPTPST